MLKRLGVVAGASAALLLTTTAPAFAADGAVVSGPATAAVGSTVQMSVEYTIDDVTTVLPLTSLNLSATLSGPGNTTPTGATFAAAAPLPAGVGSCAPFTGLQGIRSTCVWTLPGSGTATVTVVYDVSVPATATVGEVWTVGAQLADAGDNPLPDSVNGTSTFTITAAPTTSPSPTASAAPTSSASPSSAPVPTAVPAGATPGGGSSSAPLLWGLALVAGTAALIGGGRLVTRQRP